MSSSYCYMETIYICILTATSFSPAYVGKRCREGFLWMHPLEWLSSGPRVILVGCVLSSLFLTKERSQEPQCLLPIGDGPHPLFLLPSTWEWTTPLRSFPSAQLWPFIMFLVYWHGGFPYMVGYLPPHESIRTTDTLGFKATRTQSLHLTFFTSSTVTGWIAPSRNSYAGVLTGTLGYDLFQK